MALPHPFGRPPKYEIRNLLVKTFHLIYYTITITKPWFFGTWWSRPTPVERPQYMKSETDSSRPFTWYTTRLPLNKLWFFGSDDLAPPPWKGPIIWNPLPGMPCSVGRHYDDVIHPVTWLWRRYEWCYGRCHWRITLVFPLLFCKAHLFHINCFKHFVCLIIFYGTHILVNSE